MSLPAYTIGVEYSDVVDRLEQRTKARKGNFRKTDTGYAFGSAGFTLQAMSSQELRGKPVEKDENGKRIEPKKDITGVFLENPHDGEAVASYLLRKFSLSPRKVRGGRA